LFKYHRVTNFLDWYGFRTILLGVALYTFFEIFFLVESENNWGGREGSILSGRRLTIVGPVALLIWHVHKLRKKHSMLPFLSTDI
jgi:membrane-bound acyltransferase YfiQ involved in biofilm formation